MRSAPLRANTVCKSSNSFDDALFTQGLTALMQPTNGCVRALSVREVVIEASGAVRGTARVPSTGLDQGLVEWGAPMQTLKVSARAMAVQTQPWSPENAIRTYPW